MGSAPLPFSIGVRSDQHELASIIDKAVAHLPPGEVDAIRLRWLLVANPEPVCSGCARALWPRGLPAARRRCCCWPGRFRCVCRSAAALSRNSGLADRIAFQTALLDSLPLPVFVSRQPRGDYAGNPAFRRFLRAIGFGEPTSIDALMTGAATVLSGRAEQADTAHSHCRRGREGAGARARSGPPA
ncbi:MAG: hypothetical protein WDN30_10245 [Pararobbsia sp.]